MSSAKAPRRLGTVDRFEGETAVLLVDGQEERRARTRLPAQTREGDVVDLETGELVPEERERMLERVKAAREKAPTPGSGNFDL